MAPASGCMAQLVGMLAQLVGMKIRNSSVTTPKATGWD